MGIGAAGMLQFMGFQVTITRDYDEQAAAAAAMHTDWKINASTENEEQWKTNERKKRYKKNEKKNE